MPSNDAAMEAERLRAKALARWEGEGGALGPSREDEHRLDETEIRILSRLGAALLGEWHKLPTDMQRAIFSRAAALRPAADGARVKSEIARFLHDHKDH